jgi:prepilin-type processing-associated H-X9-DG protein
MAVILMCAATFPFIGSCTRSRYPANRVKCASNLRQIGQALLLYANENKGNYPRTTYVEADVVKPVWGTNALVSMPFSAEGPMANDVTAALFLLIRTQDITSEVFVCPSSDAVKDTYDGNTQLNRSNFTDVAGNLSYSYANPYPNRKVAEEGYVLTSSLSGEFAVAADFNPGTATGEENVKTVKADDPVSKIRSANSLNHDGDGQNVLYGDGHVEFSNTPFVGIEKDNIYTAKTGGIDESPADATDSVLLPAMQ